MSLASILKHLRFDEKNVSSSGDADSTLLTLWAWEKTSPKWSPTQRTANLIFPNELSRICIFPHSANVFRTPHRVSSARLEKCHQPVGIAL